MLEDEPWTGADRRMSILRRHDNGRLRQQAQGMRLCPGKPSNAASLSVEVEVVICGQIMSPAFEQSDDPVGWVRRYFSAVHNRTAASRRFSDPFGRLLTLYHGELNSLFVFKTDFGERFKNPVFIEGFDGFRHV